MFLLKFKFFIVFLTIFSLFLSCGGDGNTGGIDEGGIDEGGVDEERLTAVINAVNTGTGKIGISVTSEADAVITVEAHKDAAFGDTAPVSETKTSIDNNALEFVLDVDAGVNYYIRAQAEKNGLTSDWVAGDSNPYLASASIGNFVITDITPLLDSGNILVEAQGPEITNISLVVASDQDFTSQIMLPAEDLTEVVTGSTRTITISNLPLSTSLYFRTVSSTGGIVDVYSTPVIATDGTLVSQHIHRLSELAKIGVDTMNYPMSGTYLLEKDLNFADADNNGTMDDPFDADTDSSNGNWIPIAPNDIASSRNPFTGTFDGQEHTITGMNINEAEGTAMIQQGAGLFGDVGSASISNLGLIDVAILTNKKYVGGLAGVVVDVTIKNCYVKGGSGINAHFSNALAGGLLGFLTGNLSNSYALIDVGTMSGLFGSGRGGLVGGMYSSAAVLNSYAAGSVAGFSDVGGLVGYTAKDITITKSYATGTVTGFKNPADQSDPLFIGGLVGSFSPINNNILFSFASGDVLLGGGAETGTNFGGLIGSSAGNVTNSYVYDGQTVDIDDGFDITSVDSATLGTAAFYTRDFVDNGGTGDVLGLDWDGDTPGSAEWHIAGPITNGNFPRVNKDGETSDTAANEVPGQEDISIPSSS